MEPQDTGSRMRILIVDDDKMMRTLISKYLKKWEYEVIHASNGLEALKIIEEQDISFVLSDWMMPELDGLELCRRIRASDRPGYIYVILLTAKHEKNELVEGMDAGADDFMTKPFNKNELEVRIRAGERILRLERNLEERNRTLQDAYRKISEDLKAAAAMQQSLLPGESKTIGGITFDWIFLPCTFVAGDIFNFFRLDESKIGFYLLDVAGHGIPAAMLSVTLSKVLSSIPGQSNPFKRFVADPPHYKIKSPAAALQDLNEQFQTENDAMQYFTMVYGIIDTAAKKLCIGQAGHPSPILLTHQDGAELIGTGGFPVGMLSGLEYEESEFDFAEGDRFFVYSDGVTESVNPAMRQFSEERLVELISNGRELPLDVLLSQIRSSLKEWTGGEEFDDDVTMLALDWNGASSGGVTTIAETLHPELAVDPASIAGQ